MKLDRNITIICIIHYYPVSLINYIIKETLECFKSIIRVKQTEALRFLSEHRYFLYKSGEFTFDILTPDKVTIINFQSTSYLTSEHHRQ